MFCEYKYALGGKVKIIDLEMPGVVRSIRIELTGLSYLVTYWADSKLNEVWLWEHELGVC